MQHFAWYYALHHPRHTVAYIHKSNLFLKQHFMLHLLILFPFNDTPFWQKLQPKKRLFTLFLFLTHLGSHLAAPAALAPNIYSPTVGYSLSP